MHYNLLHPHCGPFNSVSNVPSKNPIDEACRQHDIAYGQIQKARKSTTYPYYHWLFADVVFVQELRRLREQPGLRKIDVVAIDRYLEFMELKRHLNKDGQTPYNMPRKRLYSLRPNDPASIGYAGYPNKYQMIDDGYDDKYYDYQRQTNIDYSRGIVPYVPGTFNLQTPVSKIANQKVTKATYKPLYKKRSNATYQTITKKRKKTFKKRFKKRK